MMRRTVSRYAPFTGRDDLRAGPAISIDRPPEVDGTDDAPLHRELDGVEEVAARRVRVHPTAICRVVGRAVEPHDLVGRIAYLQITGGGEPRPVEPDAEEPPIGETHLDVA